MTYIDQEAAVGDPSGGGLPAGYGTDPDSIFVAHSNLRGSVSSARSAAARHRKAGRDADAQAMDELEADCEKQLQAFERSLYGFASTGFAYLRRPTTAAGLSDAERVSLGEAALLLADRVPPEVTYATGSRRAREAVVVEGDGFRLLAHALIWHVCDDLESVFGNESDETWWMVYVTDDNSEGSHGGAWPEWRGVFVASARASEEVIENWVRLTVVRSVLEGRLTPRAVRNSGADGPAPRSSRS